jgi:hypothetical protein
MPWLGRPSGEAADGTARTRSGPFWTVLVDLKACPDGGIRDNATEPHIDATKL